MLCKLINEIANVPNKEILISSDTRTRSKHVHQFHKMAKILTNTNIQSCLKPYPNGTFRNV